MFQTGQASFGFVLQDLLLMRLFIIPFNSYSLSTEINLILELMSCKVSRVQLIQQAAELFQWISGHGHEFLV